MPKENQLSDDVDTTGELDIDNDTADFASGEDQGFDTLEDAISALDDDEGLTEEQTDLEDGDLTSEDGETSEDGDETDADEDLEEGDDVLVALGDGEQVNLGELKKGYFRSKDYTHKTEALAQERKSVEALRESYSQNADVLQTAYHNLTQFLEGLIPAEPDLALAQSDPATYQYQQALRSNAIAELQKVYAGRQEAEGAIQGASEKEIARHRSEEDAKLVAALPMLKDPGRKAAFEASVKKPRWNLALANRKSVQPLITASCNWCTMHALARSLNRTARMRADALLKSRVKAVVLILFLANQPKIVRP